MKRNIIYAFLIAAALLFTACGSDSKVDPIAPIEPDPSIVDTTGMTLTAAPSEINIATAGETKTINLFLAKGTNPVSNINIKANIFNQNNGVLSTYSVTTDEIGQAIFEYTAPVSLPASDLVITFEVEKGTPLVSTAVTVKFSGATVPPLDTTGMTLAVVPSDINITKTGESKAISLYLSKSGIPVNETNIVASFFNPVNGTLNSYTVTTNINGQAVFNYTAPENLPVGTNFNITFDVENASVSIAQLVNVAFVAQTTPPINTTGMTLTTVPTDINITTASESKVISLYLANGTNPVADTNITANFFDPAKGTLNSYSVTTNANGQAVFEYTAPASLPTSDLIITFSVENGSPFLEEDVTVYFKVPPVVSYQLVRETTPIEITTPKQVELISVYVVDSLGVGVTEKTVTISNPAFGALTSASSVSDSSGFVEFSYQAPADLTGLSSTIVTLRLEENGVIVSKDVNITVSAAPIGVSKYSLVNVTTPMVIGTGGEIKEIAVQLVKDGTPQVGATLTAKSIPSSFGSISNVNVTTGADGYARFTYVAADSLTDGEQPLEIYYDDSESGERISTIVMLTVLEQSPSLPTIVIPNETKINTLTVNSQLVAINIRVFAADTNVPYSEGSVKVELPQKILSGIDVGTFVSYEVNITNGIASFEYTGPNDLQGLVDSGDLNSTFYFYHSDNPTEKKAVQMLYEPDIEDGYIPVNYILNVGSEDGLFTMGLQQEKTFNVILTDDQGTQVPDTNLTSITITSKNTFIGKLLDNGVPVNSITKTGTNPVNFNITTTTKSGLLPIDIVVNFVDANGNPQEMNQTVNMVVYSGPPTAMSISYVGVEQDEERAKYKEKFAVTVVDAYNNKVNTQPNISLGGIVEYTVDGSSLTGTQTTTSPRLWYGKFDSVPGSIVPTGDNGATFETPTGGNIFQYVDFNNDRLVLFGEGYVYEALGKWDILPGASHDTLSLQDDYFGSLREGLYFAAGHNYRQDLCSSDGREYVGAAESETYQVDTEGTALVSFVYDYHLTGKDIMLWVNLDGYQADSGINTRIGEARKHTLRGNGFKSVPEAYTVVGTGVTVRFEIEHANAPEWYENAKFSYAVTGDCFVENVVGSSNDFDARECYNGGTGVTYVDLNVSPTTGTTCTVRLEDIRVSTEFTTGR